MSLTQASEVFCCLFTVKNLFSTFKISGFAALGQRLGGVLDVAVSVNNDIFEIKNFDFFQKVGLLSRTELLFERYVYACLLVRKVDDLCVGMSL